MLACSERIRPVPARHARPDEPVSEHAALAASFVSNDSASLRRLLHPDLVVQPPEPDSARQGAAAIEYLLSLAAHTSVKESRLFPQVDTPEGPFVFEQGFWRLRTGDRTLHAPYTLRWRGSSEGWKVVLLRWGQFR